MFKNIKVWLILSICICVTASITIIFNVINGYASSPLYGDEAIARLSYIPAEGSYDFYMQSLITDSKPSEIIVLEGSSFSRGENVSVLTEFEGKDLAALTQEDGYIEWDMQVDKPGLYQMKLLYFPIAGKSSDIERELIIDGVIPFAEASALTFSRVWEDASIIKRDNRDNDIKPRQIENPMWMEQPLRSSTGEYLQPFYFYFSEGLHTIRLESVKEPMVIAALTLYQEEEIQSYTDTLIEYRQSGYTSAQNIEIYINAETTSRKSSPALTPSYDRSSSLTEPSSPSKQRLNVIGGSSWNISGNWVEYDFYVPESGLYNIALRAKQSINRGISASRKISIDGKVPFKEAENVKFHYSSNWTLVELGDNNGAYDVYLTEGMHTMRIESQLGSLSEFSRVISGSVSRLNDAYRRLLMVTGPKPDTFRDYNIGQTMPDIVELLRTESCLLYEAADAFAAEMGEKSTYTAVLQNMALKLERMAQKPDTIPVNMSSFKSGISSLGDLLSGIRKCGMEIDYILVVSPDHQYKRANENIFEKLVFEAKSLVASFFEDYNSIGNVADEGRVINVWMNGSRDQSQILKSLIDSYFTPETGINVNLKLVQGALLQATVAGRGPDVALSVSHGDPVNYALRGAAYDLTNFDDYTEVMDRFTTEAMVPFTFNGGTYALPERMTFPVLYYRKDIFSELGLEVPETWQDVYAMLPVLQHNNMTFGIPVSDVQSNNSSGIVSFGMLLYQQGGQFYTDDGSRSLMDSEPAISAMRQFSGFYQNYSLPLKYDFSNRFRSGEMPVAIADYTVYNTLTIFAPEIRNLWSFAQIPGTLQENGQIDRSVPLSVTGCMILSQSIDKEAGWEFLKWWSSAQIQIEYGRGLESLLGETGRYPTANLEAMNSLPWSARDYRTLESQFNWVKGIPEVPGGYFSWRHIDNAFRSIVNDSSDENVFKKTGNNTADIRETMLDYTKIINEEVLTKRIEFKLDTR